MGSAPFLIFGEIEDNLRSLVLRKLKNFKAEDIKEALSESEREQSVVGPEDLASVALRRWDSPKIADSDQFSGPGIAVMPLAPAAMALSTGLVRRYQAEIAQEQAGGTAIPGRRRHTGMEEGPPKTLTRVG